MMFSFISRTALKRYGCKVLLSLYLPLALYMCVCMCVHLRVHVGVHVCALKCTSICSGPAQSALYVMAWLG